MKGSMKLTVLFIAVLLASSVKAQDCGYYSMLKGMVLGYQTLDAKGKLTGTVTTTCMDVVNTGNVVLFKLKSEYADGKNSNQSTREFAMKCEDGNFYMDMNSLIDPKSMESFNGMEVKVDANDMVYPSSLSAGQTLPDANITISAGTGGMTLMNMVVAITNRKVAGVESITVPAGTFECYKITYDMETKMMFKINTAVAEYVNMGVGNVKTESFDKKGKIVSTTLLSELRR